MHPFYEQVELGQHQSIKVKTYLLDVIDVPLHFHPEIELVYIKKSSGTVFVRDSRTRFTAGDIFLFGANVPHLFIDDDPIEKKGRARKSQLTVLHFKPRVFQDYLFNLPEFEAISALFSRANAGLKLSLDAKSDLQRVFAKLAKTEGVDLLVSFISLLDKISRQKDISDIDHLNAESGFNTHMPTRLQTIVRYLIKNYQNDVSLDDIAALANMNKSAFCRYFKKHTRKTFSAYLNGLRIDYACKLLANQNHSVSHVAYRVGYNNPSYFVKQFKLIKGVTPTDYQADAHRTLSKRPV